MKIVAYKGRGNHPWRWRLVARNGKIVADSAEGYATKSNLVRAIERVTPYLYIFRKNSEGRR